MSNKNFKIITVDGESACGKSTIGNYLSVKFGYKHIDSGMLFRGLAYSIHLERLNIEEIQYEHIEQIISKNFYFDSYKIHCKNNKFSDLLGTEEIGLLAFEIGKCNTIQKHFIDFQRNIVDNFSTTEAGVIVSGRIAGSVVFRDAFEKFFLTAPLKVKASRRKKQLQNRGFGGMRETSILDSLKERDNLLKILPSNNIDICNRTNIIDTSLFKIEEIPYHFNKYF